MGNTRYEVFISYKRKSLPTANNLYYRLTTRGYSTFFDLEEMGRDNFDVQLLKYIENAKDVFIILEEGSLDGCKQENWEEKDWFCHEIAFALEKKKNIIPILLNGYKMPSEDFFPDKLKELSLKNAPEFNFSFFEAYLDKLVEKKYLLSKPNIQGKATSVFKFYSNENCQVFKEGKLVCSLEGMSDEPYYLPVPRKGDYRFKAVNSITSECRVLNEEIDAVEEKNVEIKWSCELNNMDLVFRFFSKMKGYILLIAILLSVVIFTSVILYLHNTNNAKTFNANGVEFKLIKVPSGSFTLGTKDQLYIDETPQTEIEMNSFYIGETEVTRALWYAIMTDAKTDSKNIQGQQYPIYNISYNEIHLFVNRLNKILKSQIGNLKFRLPTEIEWEYAAKGGMNDGNTIYSGSNNVNEVGWYEGNSSNNIHKVASKKPNNFGLYDMSGNVWECCSNAYFDYSNINSLVLVQDVDTIMSCVRRGGSWKDAENCLRTTFRSQQLLIDRKNNVGFRLVLSE